MCRSLKTLPPTVCPEHCPFMTDLNAKVNFISTGLLPISPELFSLEIHWSSPSVHGLSSSKPTVISLLTAPGAYFSRAFRGGGKGLLERELI